MPSRTKRMRLLLSLNLATLILIAADLVLRVFVPLPPSLQQLYLTEFGRDYSSCSAYEPPMRLTDGGYFLPDDMHSDSVNIDNGYRRTIGQPAIWQHTVWVFGNSTLYGYCMDDAHTLASQLQRLLPQFRVVNAGLNSETVPIHVARLRDTPIAPGDIVIFYDGVSDTYDPPTIPAGSPACADPVARFVLCVDRRGADVQRVQNFQSGVAAARDYVTRHGAMLYVFLQPSAYTIRPNLYTRSLLRYFPDETYPVQQAYALLRQTPGVVDLSSIFDNQSVFIDPFHVNDAGNAALALVIERTMSV